MEVSEHRHELTHSAVLARSSLKVAANWACWCLVDMAASWSVRSATDWALASMSGPCSRNRIFSSKSSPMVVWALMDVGRITTEFRTRASGAHPLMRSVNSSRFSRGGPRWEGEDRHEHARSLVSRSILQGTIQFPDVTHALVHESLEGVILLVRTTTPPGRERAPGGFPPKRPVAAGSIVPRSP